MEIITESDVLRLANALSVKTELNIKLNRVSQCTSDFMLTIYNAIMGELPVGVLSECLSLDSQLHNVKCIVDTLADDYLHVDLSHISPEYFVSGDHTTIYNLLEILDGLLEFMLDQISNDLDSGDEGDIDSDIMSEKRFAATWGGIERKSNRFGIQKVIMTEHFKSLSRDFNLDSSTCTADLIALDLDDDTKRKTRSNDDSFVSLEKSSSPDVEWQELKSSGSISEHTLTSADLDSSVRSSTIDRAELSAPVSDADRRQPTVTLQTETYRIPNDAESLRSSVSSGRVPAGSNGLGETYKKSSGPPSLDVVLDSARKGSAISVSDVTSEHSDGIASVPSVTLEPRKVDSKQETESSHSSSSMGTDVADGIPKPVMHDRENRPHTHEERPSRPTDVPQLPHERDWGAMLNNLQKTVEESRRIREKYFTTPHDETLTSDVQTSENEDSLHGSYQAKDSAAAKGVQRNVRFEDTVSTKTAKELKQFREVLQREKQLQCVKNKILSDSYRDHLEEVEDVERRKVMPLRKKAGKTERELRSRIGEQRKRTVKTGSHAAALKRDLATAAKWKSWQRPVVRTTPQRRPPIPNEKKIRGRLEVGEHDLLPLLMAEFPGLQLSSTTLNNAWKKQFRQIENLTSQEAGHAKSKRHTEQQLQEAHRRHHLLTDIMRKEHEHTLRVREAKERAAGQKEAARGLNERRQQSARVRRYYRDYQLQMRARMLKRRTREEKLFKDLFEDGLHIQRERLRELRSYARDKRQEQKKRQQNEIASLENYYKDQFTILAETLDSEKTELRVRDKAQTDLLRRMKSGLREKMEHEIQDLQDKIARDDDDIYFRELEADRIRRQLQLATYHAKFNGSLTQSM